MTILYSDYVKNKKKYNIYERPGENDNSSNSSQKNTSNTTSNKKENFLTKAGNVAKFTGLNILSGGTYGMSKLLGLKGNNVIDNGINVIKDIKDNLIDTGNVQRVLDSGKNLLENRDMDSLKDYLKTTSQVGFSTAGDIKTNLLKGMSSTIDATTGLLGGGWSLANKAGSKVWKAGSDVTKKVEPLSNFLLEGSKWMDVASNMADDQIKEGVRPYQNLIDKGRNKLNINENSIAGSSTDELFQSAGQSLMGIMFGEGANVPIGKLNMPITSLISGTEAGLEKAMQNDGNALQIAASMIGSGFAEGFSEGMFGMFGFGGNEITDALSDSLVKKMRSSFGKWVAKTGVSMAGEAVEELASNAINWLVYNGIVDKLGDSDFSEEFNWGDTLREMIMAGISAGFTSGPANIASANSISNNAVTEAQEQSQRVEGRNLTDKEIKEVKKNAKEYAYLNDQENYFTKNEQTVIDAEVNDRAEELQKTGKKVNKKQIRKEVIEDLKKGYISTETIEKSINGDNYSKYNETKESIKNKNDRLNELQKTINSEKDLPFKTDKYYEAVEEAKTIQEELNNLNKTNYQNNYNNNLYNKIKNDRYIKESYNERARKGQKFDADISKYDTNVQKTIQKAIDSGVLNNTNRTHEFVDFIAKLSSDKGVDFDFTNNENLKKSNFALKDRTINGFVNENGITINIDSNEALNKVVGHEITHILEDTELYNQLSQSLKNVIGTEEWNNRIEQLTEMYENVDNANIENELVADLVGEKLFTDENFVRNLSVEKPNLFQKIFNEIKYLCKVATSGSKEEKELLKAKKVFEELYRENGNKVNDAKYHISENVSDDIDYLLKNGAVRGLVKLRDYTPNELLKYGVEEAQMYMKSSHILENILSEEQALRKGMKVDKTTHYHGLGKQIFMRAIDSLDKPVAVLRWNPNNYNKYGKDDFIILTNIKNNNGEKIFVPLYLKKTKKNVYEISTSTLGQENVNEIKTVYSKPRIYKYFNDYINDGSLELLYTKKSETSDGVQFSMTSFTSDNNISQNNKNVKSDILPTNSNMQKDVKNTSFSLSKNGELQDSEGNKVKLETSNVGITGTLMAIHNLNESKMKGILELGGFPVPSIAITDVNIYSHDSFGDISVLFDKSTIDPKIKENEVYSSDAYSPRFPQIENKINKDVIDKLIKDAYKYDINYLSASTLENLAENGKFDIDNVPDDLMEYYFKKNGIEYTNENRDLYENGDKRSVYEKWVEDLGNSIIGEKRVIRPDVDLFTPSGNRRTLEQRSYEYTLDNIVKIMANKNTKGSENNYIVSGTVRANLASQFNSIEDIKNNRNKIVSSTEMEQIKKNIDTQFYNIIEKLAPYYKYYDENSWGISDIIADSINETAKAKNINEKTLKNKLEANFINDVPIELLSETIDFLDNLKDTPTEYFEAKPQRAVGLDEIQMLVIPSDTDSDFKQQLQDNNIKYIEYNKDIEGDRQRVINQFDNLKFSLSNNKELLPTRNQNLTYGKDIKLQNQMLTDLSKQINDTNDKVNELLSNLSKNDLNKSKIDTSNLEITDKQLQTLTNEERSELEDLKIIDETLGLTPDEEARLEQLKSKDFLNNSMFVNKLLNTETNQVIQVPTDAELRDSVKGIINSQNDSFVDRLINEFRTNPDLNEDIIYNRIVPIAENNAHETYVDESKKAAQDYIRKTKIKVNDLTKMDITDFNSFRRNNFGKLSLTNNQGQSIDSLYQEVINMYPGYLDTRAKTPGDQLKELSRFMNESYTQEYETTLDEDMMREQANKIYNEIMSQEAYKQLSEELMQEEPLSINEKDINYTTKNQIRRRGDIVNRQLDKLYDLYERTSSKVDRITAQIEDMQNSAVRYNENDTWYYDSMIQGLYEKSAPLVEKYVKYREKINELELEKAKLEEKYEYAQDWNQRQAKIDEYRQEAKNIIGDSSTWADKKTGIQYKVNTEHRNLRDIIRKADGSRDIAKADAIYDAYAGKYNENEALLNKEANRLKDHFRQYNITNAEDVYIQMLGEYKYNPATDLTGQMLVDYYEQNKSKIDKNKCETVIEEARSTYDSLFGRLNEVLNNQGLKPIQYRKGYFPHFYESKQSTLAKLFNWKTQNNEIPTSIAGLTEDFQPERSWQSFNKQRTGDTTVYNFSKGFDTYVNGALDWIYHIEDLQRRRAFENAIREQHAPESVKQEIEKIYADGSLSYDEMMEKINKVLDIANNPLNNFVVDWRSRTNNLAGKKDSMDRGLESFLNRNVYSTLTNVSNRVSANMVAGSLSSALTNFIPITQSWSQVSPLASINGLKETIKNYIHDDGTIAKSPFLTNRLETNNNLYKSGWDKVNDKTSILFEQIDNITAQTIWRSKYNQNIKKGFTEEQAIKNADYFTEGIMAGRSKGNAPTLFNSKNPILKMVTAFQLEVNNQYGYMFKDMPQDIGQKSIKNLIGGYLGMFAGAYVYNEITSKLTGRNAAFDPIRIFEELFRDLGLLGGDDDDEEKDPTTAISNFGTNVAKELPFIGGLLGGGRLPISSALPYNSKYTEGNFISGTVNDFKVLFDESADESKKQTAIKRLENEWSRPLWYLAAPLGGGQIKKTLDGMDMFYDLDPASDEFLQKREHPGSYTNSGNLRFEVDDNPMSMLQAALFGEYSSQNAQDYVNNGFKTIKDVDKYKASGMTSKEYSNFKSEYSKMKKNEDKWDYIINSDLSQNQKSSYLQEITKSSEENLTDFSSYREYKLYKSGDAKYNAVKIIAPFEQYFEYEDEISSIKKQYSNANGFTSKQRKKAIRSYIESLPLSSYQKLLLEKTAGGYSIKSYKKYVVQYLDSLELTQNEKYELYNYLILA